ncbi:MAG: Phosphonate ABC transporter permease protein phnE, partial [uncultured Frankineae bacterium]
ERHHDDPDRAGARRSAATSSRSAPTAARGRLESGGRCRSAGRRGVDRRPVGRVVAAAVPRRGAGPRRPLRRGPARSGQRVAAGLPPGGGLDAHRRPGRRHRRHERARDRSGRSGGPRHRRRRLPQSHRGGVRTRRPARLDGPPPGPRRPHGDPLGPGGGLGAARGLHPPSGCAGRRGRARPARGGGARPARLRRRRLARPRPAAGTAGQRRGQDGPAVLRGAAAGPAAARDLPAVPVGGGGAGQRRRRLHHRRGPGLRAAARPVVPALDGRGARAPGVRAARVGGRPDVVAPAPAGPL